MTNFWVCFACVIVGAIVGVFAMALSYAAKDDKR